MQAVRFLCTFAGGTGHLEPTLPVARALRLRRHEVAYACQADLLPSVCRAGFPAYDTGGATVLAPSLRRPLVPVDRAAEEEVVRRAYAGTVARERAARLRELAAGWEPDVVVRDEMAFGSAVAAEALGLPHAAVTVVAAGGFVRPDVVGEALDALRSEHGLPPDAGMLHRHLTVVPVPPGYRDPRDPLPGRAGHVRPAGWTSERRREPLVLVTLGTVFAHRRLARRLRHRGGRPRGGCPLRAAAHRGGPLNVDRCVALGVGRALDAVTATPAELKQALDAVLQDRSYRVAAEAVRAEVAALPGPERAAEELEGLGRSARQGRA